MYRTYLPTLWKIMRLLCKFLTAHSERIVSVIGEENRPKVEALSVACEALEAVVFPFVTPRD